AGTYNTSTGLWEVGHLSDNGQKTLTITAIAQAPTGEPDEYKSFAATVYMYADVNVLNNIASLEVIPQVPTEADLQIEKTVDEDEPGVDDDITFTINVTNNGPDDATGVTVTDVLPTGYDFVSSTQGTYNAGTRTITWNIGNLAASASTSFDIVAKVLASGTYNNTASVTANEPDPDTDNNNDTVTVTPDIPTANLGITKTVDDNSPSVSQNVTFTLTVTNNGPDDATGVTVTDELPSGYTYVSHSTEDGSFDEGTGEWTIGNLSNGNSATLTITATVLSSGNHTKIGRAHV